MSCSQGEAGDTSNAISDALVGSVYARLRSVAIQMLRNERDGHTLQPTALVNEALGRVLRAKGVDVRDGESLSRLVTSVMRRVLVDHARSFRARRARESEIGSMQAEVSVDVTDDMEQVIRLHEAITALQTSEPRRAQVLEQYYFGGLSTSAIAETMGVSKRTVQVELALGRRELGELLGLGGCDSDER